jgi:hypothetical protein
MITLSSLLSYHLRICCQVYFQLLDAEVFIIPFVVQVSEPNQGSSINQYILTGPRCNALDDFSAFKRLEIPNFGNLQEIDACDKSSIGNKAYQGQSQDDIFSTVPVIDASIYSAIKRNKYSTD